MSGNDNSYEELPAYKKDQDDSESGMEEPSAKRLRGAGRNWSKEKEFETNKLALEAVKNEGFWTIRHRHETLDGRKVYYDCKFKNEENVRCNSAIYLLYHADRESVSLFRSEYAHDHGQVATNTRGLQPNIRSAIKELYEQGVTKPKGILFGLRTKGLPEPPITSLKNFLQTYKKEKFGNATIDLGELAAWCIERKTPSAGDPDKAFVVNYWTGEAADDGQAQFRLFISTPRLLEYSMRSNIVHADATYKLNWHGYPVLVVGTSDRDKHFFPFGIGICVGETSADFAFIFQSIANGVQQLYEYEYRPEILVADAADSITDGFASIFGDQFKRVYCWAHMMRATDHKLERIKNKKTRERLRTDIGHLQLCPSSDIFQTVAELFFLKWRQHQQSDVSRFLDYFKSEWIDRRSGWYEGFVLHAPSTNNCLDATNNDIKNECTLRQGLSLPRFMGLLERKLLHEWSVECDPNGVNKIQFASIPTVTGAIWTEAYEWSIQSKTTLLKNFPNGQTDYFVPPEGYDVLQPGTVTRYTQSFGSMNWELFDDYVQMRNSLWIISMFGDQWQTASCTCPAHLKDFVCKHTVGIAIRRKLCIVPKTSKSQALGGKRKRGRPKAATAALIKD